MNARRPTKEVGAEQGLGVMSRLPHCALVRSYVLNSLENGPARVADLVQRGRAEFGFSHGEGLGPNPKPVRGTGAQSARQSFDQTIGAEPNYDLRS